MNSENSDRPLSGRVLLEWRAPGRPFRERDKSWFTTVAVIVVLVSFVALLLGEFLLLGVVFALAFLSYVLSTRRPDEVAHQIMESGVVFGGKAYSWAELEKYWFQALGGERALVISLKKGFPPNLIFLLDNVSEEEVKKVLGDRLEPGAAPPEDWMDRSARWLSDKVGLN